MDLQTLYVRFFHSRQHRYALYTRLGTHVNTLHIKIKKDYVKGFSLGVSAHGMGTSRAFQISDKAGAFSGLAMGLAGIVTAFAAPMIAPPLLNWLLN